MSQQAKQPINSVDTPTYWIDNNTSKNSASIAEEAQEEVVQQQTKKSKNNNKKPRKVDGDNFILHYK